MVARGLQEAVRAPDMRRAEIDKQLKEYSSKIDEGSENRGNIVGRVSDASTSASSSGVRNYREGRDTREKSERGLCVDEMLRRLVSGWTMA